MSRLACFGRCWRTAAIPLLWSLGTAGVNSNLKPVFMLLCMVQVAGQAVPLTKEVTGGIVRPGGKEVARVADKYSDDATRDKVQVSRGTFL